MAATGCGGVARYCLRRPVDFGCRTRQRLFLVIAAPDALRDEVLAQACDRLAVPMRADLRVIAIASRIIGGGVIAQAIGQCLDQARAVTGAGAREGSFHTGANRDHIVAVDLLARNARGDRLLRESLCCALR